MLLSLRAACCTGWEEVEGADCYSWEHTNKHAPPGSLGSCPTGTVGREGRRRGYPLCSPARAAVRVPVNSVSFRISAFLFWQLTYL